MYYPEKESVRLEFKITKPKKDQILKTVCGLANQFGGRLVIGVDDDGVITGVADAEAIELQQYLDQHIVQGVFPPVIPQVMAQRIDDKLVVIVEVAPGSQKPYYVRAEGPTNGVYIRLGASTHRAPPELIEDMRWQSRGRSWDTIPFFQASSHELSAQLLAQFGRSKSIAGEVDETLLEHYQIVTREQNHICPSTGGLLLFAEQPQRYFADAFIICTHYKECQERSVLAAADCTGPLMQQLDLALEFVQSRLYHQWHVSGKMRQERLEIPEVAIREAIINALMHRHYGLPSPIKIAIDRHVLEVWSPGAFACPLPASHYRSGITHARNPLIARVFRELKLAERLGSGLAIMLDSCEKAGLRTPDILEGPNWVKVTLFRGPATSADATESILDECLHGVAALGSASAEQVSKHLGISSSTARRRLNALIEQGRLIRQGQGPATRYTICGDGG